MNLNDFIALTELLKDFRGIVDADWARRVTDAGWPDGKEVYLQGAAQLESIDAIIELVGVYQLNSPVTTADDSDPAYADYEQAKVQWSEGWREAE